VLVLVLVLLVVVVVVVVLVLPPMLREETSARALARSRV
jgi:hypothetical protein